MICFVLLSISGFGLGFGFWGWFWVGLSSLFIPSLYPPPFLPNMTNKVTFLRVLCLTCEALAPVRVVFLPVKISKVISLTSTQIYFAFKVPR